MRRVLALLQDFLTRRAPTEVPRAGEFGIEVVRKNCPPAFANLAPHEDTPVEVLQEILCTDVHVQGGQSVYAYFSVKPHGPGVRFDNNPPSIGILAWHQFEWRSRTKDFIAQEVSNRRQKRMVRRARFDFSRYRDVLTRDMCCRSLRCDFRTFGARAQKLGKLKRRRAARFPGRPSAFPRSKCQVFVS